MKHFSVWCLLLVLAGTAFAAAPVKKKSVPAAAVGKKKPAVKTGIRRPMAAANRRPTASSRAIYSRSNSRRARGTSTRIATTAAKPQAHWQTRPTAERYTEIQQTLAVKGFFKGEANGSWGSDSVSALKDFQRSQNLEPDGKLGSLSLIALGMGPKRIIASADTSILSPAQQPQQ